MPGAGRAWPEWIAHMSFMKLQQMQQKKAYVTY
jgi:hypothetical protein